MSAKQICIKCHRSLASKNFIGKSGRPVKSCSNCRKVTDRSEPMAYQEPEQQDVIQYDDSDSDSESSSCASSSSESEDEFQAICRPCNKEFHDYRSAEKHAKSREHKLNTQ